jgi:hypothetical protein
MGAGEGGEHSGLRGRGGLGEAQRWSRGPPRTSFCSSASSKSPAFSAASMACSASSSTSSSCSNWACACGRQGCRGACGRWELAPATSAGKPLSTGASSPPGQPRAGNAGRPPAVPSPWPCAREAHLHRRLTLRLLGVLQQGPPGGQGRQARRHLARGDAAQGGDAAEEGHQHGASPTGAHGWVRGPELRRPSALPRWRPSTPSPLFRPRHSSGRPGIALAGRAHAFARLP